MRFLADAERLRIRDEVLQRLELGHVAARLERHLQALVVGRQPPGLVSPDRPRHAVFAEVVGRKREVPVAVQLVERLKVVERGVGGGDHVAARVGPPVLAQLVLLAGRGNELPQARSVRARVGHGVERALDHGQERDLGRHAALFHFLDDVVEIELAALDHALEILRLACVPALALAHPRAVEIGHREAVADALPEIVRGAREIDRVRSLGIFDCLRFSDRRRSDGGCFRAGGVRGGHGSGSCNGGRGARCGRYGPRCRGGIGRRRSRRSSLVSRGLGSGIPRNLRAGGSQHAYRCRRQFTQLCSQRAWPLPAQKPRW